MKFTYQSYIGLLNKLQVHGYHMVGYDNWEDYDRCVILRHDIDYDIKKAVNLAILERKFGGDRKSTRLNSSHS